MFRRKPHVVILGAGFGGVYTAKKLLPYVRKGLLDVTLINKTNYFLFTPLLHEVATGSLSLRSVAEPLREIFSGKGIHIVQGQVEGIHAKKQTVKVRQGDIIVDIDYDYLVIASGSETNYYDIPGAEQNSFPLKSLMDAADIRSRVIDVFERAILCRDQTERLRLLSFAVVGGGATGVELAAELAEFVSGMIKRYYSRTNCDLEHVQHCRAEEPTISLVHNGKGLLEQFKPSLGSAALRRLRQRGVIFHLQSSVTEVTSRGLHISGNRSISAATVMWVAGVKAVTPSFADISPILQAGRLVVDEYFHLQGQPRIFVLGDAAAYVDRDDFENDSKNVRSLPMLAQVAEASSVIVARNVIASLAESPLSVVHYHSKGSMVSVGQWFAVGEIWSLNMAGRLTWWLWRMVYGLALVLTIQ